MKYEMIIRWSNEDNCYLVALPDFPGQQWRTHGNTYEQAAKNGREVLELLIATYEDKNQPLPTPRVQEIEVV